MTRIPHRISTLCSRASAWTDDPLPSIRTVEAAVRSARIPAHQINNIWHFFEEDREAILRGLKLRPKAAKPGPKPRARAAAESVAA